MKDIDRPAVIHPTWGGRTFRECIHLRSQTSNNEAVKLLLDIIHK